MPYGSPLARWVAIAALGLPLLVLVLIGLHGLWFQSAAPLSTPRRLVAERGLHTCALIPAGLAERAGAGGHPAVDLRPAPLALEPWEWSRPVPRHVEPARP